jgi:uncharacterized membrane protein
MAFLAFQSAWRSQVQTAEGGKVMATNKSIDFAGMEGVQPVIRDIGWDDLVDSLKKGLDDFKTYPSHLVLLVVIYPVLGMILARLTFGYDILPLLFPIISGFALIGPLAAVSLYELSRRREQGGKVSWKHAFAPFRSPSIGSILALGVLQLVIYFVWLVAAQTIYWMTFGNVVPVSITGFVYEVLTTPAGWALIIVGGGVGFLFAVTVLIISVVSFPMILDREVSALEAVQTSIRAVMANPMTMAMWGLIVAVLLGIGMLPLFVGLAVTMPVLGHATWHLYRKVVSF